MTLEKYKKSFTLRNQMEDQDKVKFFNLRFANIADDAAPDALNALAESAKVLLEGEVVDKLLTTVQRLVD